MPIHLTLIEAVAGTGRYLLLASAAVPPETVVQAPHSLERNRITANCSFICMLSCLFAAILTSWSWPY